MIGETQLEEIPLRRTVAPASTTASIHDVRVAPTKRVFDVVFASALLLVSSPFLILAAIAVYLDSGRPILFRQKRAATPRALPVYMLKFRTMHKDAEEMRAALTHLNESSGGLFKLRDDPRITAGGRLLRRLSIDELPQLVNVLLGDMSLVGPRLLPVTDLDKLDDHDRLLLTASRRDRVRPGITGLWQIRGRSHLGFHDMMVLDRCYIQKQSLLVDLWILLATIPAVLRGRGTY